ncbi:chorismate mutase [Catenovulum agarivorans DS-2]|uniref:Bifunctional chorismate mutase/prephenate dehydratase n=1 Tax=Catenovulum agarivorans DS-2 TaxID=1328313 RepID=W7QT33_9ALTE|nr:prephenate dehydratase [Catenovulum agarivorans]EWH12177.1 chorismate mutase [Catenovulum agarivorans DS-2]
MEKIDLDKIRVDITNLDEQLLSLLAQRRALSIQVVKSKVQDQKPVRDSYRETLLLQNLSNKGKKLGLKSDYIHSVYRTIIEDSVELQQDYLMQLNNPNLKSADYKVAYLGSKGSYSHSAVEKYLTGLNGGLIDVGCKSFDDIFAAVEDKDADVGVLPIENTSSGSINEVYDLLQTTRLKIIDELYIPVKHNLLVACESDLSKITTIYGHHQPVAQCSDFLNELNDVEIVVTDSTSTALSEVKKINDPSVAVLGSAEAGKHYGLQSIRADVANQKDNQTRFIVVAREPVTVPMTCAAKTSLILSVGQRPGALVDALMIFKQFNISMCKIESRPIKGRPWEEMFYIDVTENLQSENMQSAIRELKPSVSDYTELGCYVNRSSHTEES